MYVYYNPNPEGRMVDDCAIRAVAKALNVDWQMAYALTVSKGYDMCDMPSSNSVWGNVLADHGFAREAISSSCPRCYTASDFCADHPVGIYVLGFGSHVATEVNGDLFDSWNSANEIPQYYWYRKEERE